MKTVLWVSISLGAAVAIVCPEIAAAQQRASLAQEVTAQFLAEYGARVEVLGLQHWTPAMLQDSLAVRARGASRTSPKLAATLREKLGFPETMAQRQLGDSAVNVLVALIEPQESRRVRRRNIGKDTSRSAQPRWPQLGEAARKHLNVLSDALEPPIYARAVGLLPTVPLAVRPDSTEVRQVWVALEQYRKPDEVSAANDALTSSPNVYERLAAIALLSNFEQDDAAWRTLIGAMLDPDARVGELAARVLHTFVRHAQRPVDWRPAASDIHAILNGSALQHLNTVLDVLVATGVSPDLAKPLLRDGGYAVLMFAGAASPSVRLPSHRFMRAVSGTDHTTPDQWRSWIARL